MSSYADAAFRCFYTVRVIMRNNCDCRKDRQQKAQNRDMLCDRSHFTPIYEMYTLRMEKCNQEKLSVYS